MKKIALFLVMSAAACASDPPPSCQQAIGHFYGAGCTYVNTSTGSATSQGDALNTCLQIAGAVPSQCVDKFDAWLNCNNEVPSPASNDACVSCTQQFMALIECR